MTPTSAETPILTEAPDADFWSECRREALRLNIPAWMIAEQSFIHGSVDEGASTR